MEATILEEHVVPPFVDVVSVRVHEPQGNIEFLWPSTALIETIIMLRTPTSEKQ